MRLCRMPSIDAPCAKLLSVRLMPFTTSGCDSEMMSPGGTKRLMAPSVRASCSRSCCSFVTVMTPGARGGSGGKGGGGGCPGAGGDGGVGGGRGGAVGWFGSSGDGDKGGST
eukprot:4152770-Prymnesium_polylepis.5